MWGFNTHISDPNKRTVCTIALNNIPDIRGLETYHPIILAIHAQLFCSFQRFTTTTIQSSPAAVKTRPSYFNKVTVSKVLMWA